MDFADYETAHAAMILWAEQEFQKTLQLPRLTIVQNQGSGRFSIRRADPSSEDGMALKRGEIQTSSASS